MIGGVLWVTYLIGIPITMVFAARNVWNKDVAPYRQDQQPEFMDLVFCILMGFVAGVFWPIIVPTYALWRHHLSGTTKKAG